MTTEAPSLAEMIAVVKGTWDSLSPELQQAIEQVVTALEHRLEQEKTKEETEKKNG